MVKPNDEQIAALKNMRPGVRDWLHAAQLKQDKDNRRLRGEEAAEGRGKAQMLEEILKEVDGLTGPPA